MFGSERLPPRSKRVLIDAEAFTRMTNLAREPGVYNSQDEARKDGYRENLTVLMDGFEENNE